MPLRISGFVSQRTRLKSAQLAEGKASTKKASEYYSAALNYLAASDTAMQVIDILTKSDISTSLVIHPGDFDQNIFIYPEMCGGGLKAKCKLSNSVRGGSPVFNKAFIGCSRGGCIVWTPQKNIIVVEKEASRIGWGNINESHPWHKFEERAELFGNFREHFEIEPVKHTEARVSASEKRGKIPAPVLLIHEMGHALQYLMDNEHFLAIAKGKKSIIPRTLMARTEPPLDTLNVAAIENRVCLELREAGKEVGIRWRYGDDVRRGGVEMDDEWKDEATKKFSFGM